MPQCKLTHSSLDYNEFDKKTYNRINIKRIIQGEKEDTEHKNTKCYSDIRHGRKTILIKIYICCNQNTKTIN